MPEEPEKTTPAASITEFTIKIGDDEIQLHRDEIEPLHKLLGGLLSASILNSDRVVTRAKFGATPPGKFKMIKTPFGITKFPVEL
jgi:hypothetical protein